jgi:predicted lipopolysaccharide heptosyltransferase III
MREPAGILLGGPLPDAEREAVIPPPGMSETPRILVIKLRYLGDVLLSTPVVASLRAAFPGAFLSMLVNPGTEAMITDNPHLDEVLVLQRSASPLRQLHFGLALRRHRFDLVIDLTDADRAAILSRITGAPIRVGFNREGRWRGRLYTHVVPVQRQPIPMIRQHLMALDTLGMPIVQSRPLLWVRPDDETAAEAALGEIEIGPGERFVAVHPGARWWFKSWPSERFAGLIDYVQGKLGVKVALLGGDQDRGIAEAILGQLGTDGRSLVGRLGLLGLAALLRRATLFVGNDNGPMHIAAAMGTPVIGLFGPSDPRVWGPVGEGHAVIYKGVDCQGCFPGGCERGEANCMRLIEIHEVIPLVEEQLARKGMVG